MRGDRGGPIRVGRNSVVQDNSHLSGSSVGSDAFVGPNASVEAATLENDSFVGMGSVVRAGSLVKGVVAAGSVVPENTTIG